jgi:transposase InsO family protein
MTARGSSNSAQPDDDPRRAEAKASDPDPRPRQQIHRRLRRGLSFGGTQGDQGAHRSTTGESHAERWVGSVRRECLDRILIVSRRQLETTLCEYVGYYNTHRPHRSLEQQPPLLKTKPGPPTDASWRVRRRDRLGGLIHEYELAA